MEPVPFRRESGAELLARMSELYLQDRLDEATQMWAFPCPVQAGSELMVVRDAAQLRANFEAMRGPVVAAGVCRLEPRVGAIEIPRNDRFRIWVRWVHHFRHRPEEEEPFVSLYYLVRQPSGALLIEMMELIDSAIALSDANVA